MSDNLKLKHIKLWLERCRENIDNFNLIYRSLSKEDKLKYIRYQYYLIKIINNVLDGKTKISGFNFKNKNDNKLIIKENIKSDISNINI